MIIVAALLIMREAWHGFQAPRVLDAPALGLAINMGAGVLNAVWAVLLIRRGRALRSPALVADGHHLMADVVTSIGVVLGVGLAAATGWYVLDPALAGLVALNILWSGWKVMASSLSGLLDEAVSEETLEQIRATISTRPKAPSRRMTCAPATPGPRPSSTFIWWSRPDQRRHRA